MAAKFPQHPRKHHHAALDLFSLICCNGGGMELGFAISRLSPKNREVVKRTGGSKFVSEYKHLFKLQKDGSRVSVEVILPLKFCSQASEKGGCPLGRSCRKLHLCPYNIKGSCSFGEKCRSSHNIKDEHTVSILREFDIDNIDNIILLKLMKKVFDDTEIERAADNHPVPDICKFYNNIKSCSKGDRCPFLHVCQHFVDGTCKFGDECKRVHHFKDEHNVNVLEKHQLNRFGSKMLLRVLNGRERKRTTSSSSDTSEKNMHIPTARMPTASTSPADMTHGTHTAINAMCIKDNDTADICGFHLRGHCNYGNKCMHHHTELPYLWQYKELNTQGPWESLISDMNMMVEQAFCDEDKDGVPMILNGVQYHIQFDMMIAIPLSVIVMSAPTPNLEVRRLSTQSSVNAPPGHVYSTRWFWYWKDENNQWQSYDSPDSGVSPNTTCRQSLEKDLLAGESTHPFSAGIHKYTLHYKTTPMHQENDLIQTKRDVRRRPEFVSKQNMNEVAQRRKASITPTSPSADSSTSIPSHWDPIPEGQEFARVTLSTVCEEYKKSETQFQQGLASEPKRILKIERIQNPELWTEFVQRKARMTKKAKKPPDERQLFHGTSNDIVPAICQQGFDWRMCGRHGIAYGKGSYFACTSSYSHRYTDRSTARGKENHMFLARVLVGSYVLGDKSTVRPPSKDPKNPHGELYDSCVNDVNSPGLFVVFENGQAYPEYLITYL